MKKKKKIGYKFNKLYVFLSIGLVFVIFIIALSTAYFARTKSYSGTITLMEIDFSVDEISSSIENIKPGDNLNKQLRMLNSRNTTGTDYLNLCPILFRFSFDVIVNDQSDLTLKNLMQVDTYSNQNYIYSNGYFYYKDILNAGQSVNLCQSILLSNQIANLYQNQNFKILVEIEALQSGGGAYRDLWQDAPISWKNLMEQKGL